MKLLHCSVVCWFAVFSFSVHASLIVIDKPANAEKLFFTELKVDENLNDGARRGHDVFLTFADESGNNDSAGINWSGLSNLDAFNHTFSWTLSRSGTQTRFVVDNTELNHFSLPGKWNALGFVMNMTGRDGQFASASLDIDVDGSIFSSGNTGFNAVYLRNADLSPFASISGTASFSWTLNRDYSGPSFSPNSRALFSIKALEVPVGVPAPTGVALLVPALLALGWRRKVG